MIPIRMPRRTTLLKSFPSERGNVIPGPIIKQPLYRLKRRAKQPSSFSLEIFPTLWRFHHAARIQKQKNKKGTAPGRKCRVAPNTEMTTAERMRKMKGFEDIKCIGNGALKGLVMEESPNSLLIAARKKIYVPEKRIVLMDQITEQEALFIKNAAKHKGGLIV